MNSKALGLIIAFTALTTTLNFVKIPVPYMPSFNYQMGDIALVVALLILGFKAGLTVALLNMFVTLTISYGPGGFVGPPYYFIAVVSMILGVYFAARFVAPKIFKSKTNLGAKPIVAFTIITIVFRVLIMFPFDYTIYGTLVSIFSGLSVSEANAIVLASMPGIVAYNITVPLYVIPTSYFIAMKISKNLKLTNFSSFGLFKY